MQRRANVRQGHATCAQHVSSNVHTVAVDAGWPDSSHTDGSESICTRDLCVSLCVHCRNLSSTTGCQGDRELHAHVLETHNGPGAGDVQPPRK